MWVKINEELTVNLANVLAIEVQEGLVQWSVIAHGNGGGFSDHTEYSAPSELALLVGTKEECYEMKRQLDNLLVGDMSIFQHDNFDFDEDDDEDEIPF